MTALAGARERLAAHRAEIERLTSLTAALVGEVRREEDAHAARIARVEWEEERVLSKGLRAMATWPEQGSAGVKRWYVGAGVEGRLLVVWEVNEYRGRYARIIHGSAPQSVELDVMRAYELRRPGT